MTISFPASIDRDVNRSAVERSCTPRRDWDRVLAARRRGRAQVRQPKPRDCQQPMRHKKRPRTPTEDLGKRGPEPKGQAARYSHEFHRTRSECKIDEKRRGVPVRSSLCANGVADGGKSFTRAYFVVPFPPVGVVSSETDAPHGDKRVGFSQTFWCQCSKGAASWPGSARTWQN